MSRTNSADRVVPSTGLTVWLTMGVALAMAFLATFALALERGSVHLAARWETSLERSATLRLPAGMSEDAAGLAQIRDMLVATPGIATAEVISPQMQADLLRPWIGADLRVADLPLPVLIAITEDQPGPDYAGLRLRLAGEAPTAVLDDHDSWRRPLLAAAGRLRAVSSAALGLIALATAAMITLAAQSALSANRSVIAVLRQVGAQDRWIARAFTRRFTLRAGLGAALGTAAACAALSAGPAALEATGASGAMEGAGWLDDLGFNGAEWIGPLCLPVLCALIARLATDLAAMRVLKGLT